MTKHALVSTTLLFCVVACRQGEAPKPQNSQVDTAAQKREDEFRWKERCAVAAERLDKLFAAPSQARPSSNETSISEVFYSSTRNSCVCEVSTVGGSGKTGVTTLLNLYDCLTREDLGTTIINVGGPDSDKRIDEWKRKKDALK